MSIVAQCIVAQSGADLVPSPRAGFIVFRLGFSGSNPAMSAEGHEEDSEEMAEADNDDDERIRRFQSRSEFRLALPWAVLGLVAAYFANKYEIHWLQSCAAIGVLSAAIHRSFWVGLFSFLGAALMCTAAVIVILLVLHFLA